MRILAIDTSLPAVSVCVFDSGAQKVLARETTPMLKGHAEALMPMVERVMSRVGGGFASLGRVAATVGPGSFTGIRIGVAAARGIALACGIEAVGVSTLAALATPLLFADDGRIVAAVIDALHGHVYLSAYGPGGRVFTSPRLVAIADACRLLGAGQVSRSAAAPAFFGTQPGRWARTSPWSKRSRGRISSPSPSWGWSPIPSTLQRAPCISRRLMSLFPRDVGPSARNPMKLPELCDENPSLSCRAAQGRRRL